MLRFTALFLVLLTTACGSIPQTSKNPVRGTVPVTEPIESKKKPLDHLLGQSPLYRARQITAEHSSVEYYDDFTLGILEITDDGTINPSQKEQVFKMLDLQLKDGGLLIVFVHGWHHSARTCDRDLACFRAVLSPLRKSREAAYGDEVAGQKVVGVFIGWRGESLPYRGVNTATIYDRKRVAEKLGRGSAKELLLDLNERYWKKYSQTLTMISVGHSLGGAMLYQAAKETLTGNVSDIESQEIRDYRVVRSDCSREEALQGNVKARRIGFGDLIVLVNPALEAIEYSAFDDDLRDDAKKTWSREQLVEARLPYDKNDPYPANQLPVLVAIASEADSAVGTIFPLSRLVLSPWRPSYLFHANERLGIGHYKPHITHYLDYKLPLTEEEKKEREPRKAAKYDCSCTMKTADVPRGGPELDLLRLDQRQEFGEGSNYVLEPTDDRKRRGWDVNSPYLVVRTAPKIMAEHSDIFNEFFVGFLSQFMDAYYTKLERLEAENKMACQY